MARFIKRLTLWEGEFAGQPFKLHPFQEAILRRIYGPTGPDGSRLVKTAALWIPRGAAKTTLAAGLGLAHFMGPEAEPGGQIVMAAADRENAGIAFNCSLQFVRQDDALSDRVRPVESSKKLLHRTNAGTLKAISSEAYSKHGMNVSAFIADEIHAWPHAEGRKLFTTVRDSMVKRRNPFTLIISTAGEGSGGLAFDWWQYSLAVARGEVDDPTFAPIIFAADPEADWRDESQWRIANPAIDAGFCSIEEMRTKAKRLEMFPAEVADFKRFHLNMWQEGASLPWVELELYDAAEPMRDEADLIGQPCWVGIDLSTVQDLTAVVAVFADGEGGRRRYDVVPMFFLPEAGLARKAEADRADYIRWQQAGLLTVTPGKVVDYDIMVDHVRKLAERYSIQEIAIDRWNSTSVSTDLLAEGFNVVQFGQGYASMNAPVKELKRAILSGHFRHGGHPVLRLCFGNVVADTDAAENEKFTKEKARGRIDGAVAAAMAVGRILAQDTAPSPYESREFLFV